MATYKYVHMQMSRSGNRNVLSGSSQVYRKTDSTKYCYYGSCVLEHAPHMNRGLFPFVKGLLCASSYCMGLIHRPPHAFDCWWTLQLTQPMQRVISTTTRELNQARMQAVIPASMSCICQMNMQCHLSQHLWPSLSGSLSNRKFIMSMFGRWNGNQSSKFIWCHGFCILVWKQNNSYGCY